MNNSPTPPKMKKQATPDKSITTRTIPAQAETQQPQLDSFPLELVASTAARLLEGNDYIQAAQRAIALIEVCKKQIANRAIEKARSEMGRAALKAQWEKVLSMTPAQRRRLTTQEKLDCAIPISFNEMAEFLTGDNRANRAREKLLAAQEKADGGWTPKQRTEARANAEKATKSKQRFFWSDVEELSMVLKKHLASA